MANRAIRFARLLRARPVRFIVVGLSNTVVSFLVFTWLMSLPVLTVEARVPVAQALSYGAGMVWSFLWNRGWTFHRAGGGDLAGQGIRFAVVQVGCLLLSVVLVTAALRGLQWPQPVGWLAAMAVVTAVNYLATAHWVFRASP